MKKRRQKATRHKRTSSADIRFRFVLVIVCAIVLALGSLLVGQVREADWSAASISGAIILVLVAASIYSVIQKRRA